MLECINYVTQYSRLKLFLKQNKDYDIVLSDEYYSIKSITDIDFLLNAIKGINIFIHLRVEADRINIIEKYLSETIIKETQPPWSFLNWDYCNDTFIVRLKKKLQDGSEYIMRLYEDGNGVVVYIGKELQSIYYYRINDSSMAVITELISNKIDFIVSNPVWIHEDDRFLSLPVHLEYNIKWKYPHAYAGITQDKIFETIDYGFNENEITLATLLLKQPGIKDKWMRLHLQNY